MSYGSQGKELVGHIRGGGTFKDHTIGERCFEKKKKKKKKNLVLESYVVEGGKKKPKRRYSLGSAQPPEEDREGRNLKNFSPY